MTSSDKQTLLEKALEWQQPDNDGWLSSAFSGWERYFDVEYRGLDDLELPGPVLFVSSHSLLSATDILVFAGIWRQTGVLVRGLGDRLHFRVPLWRSLVKHMGIVLGDQTVAEGLLRAGQSVLVFPGGAREVVKKRREIHQLVWKQRTGFIRLAINAGVPIVPVSVYGGDTVLDIVADTDDYMNTRVGKLVDKTGILDRYARGRDELPPLVRGIGLSIVPKPKKVYVSFGKPISVADVAVDDAEALMAARAEVAASINQMMGEARQLESEQQAPMWRRLLARS